MFNYAANYKQYTNGRILWGLSAEDGESHQTIFAGPDPADPSRILIRKIVKINNGTYCLEESRVTPTLGDPTHPTVHSQVFRLGGIDVKEHLDN